MGRDLRPPVVGPGVKTVPSLHTLCPQTREMKNGFGSKGHIQLNASRSQKEWLQGLGCLPWWERVKGQQLTISLTSQYQHLLDVRACSRFFEKLLICLIIIITPIFIITPRTREVRILLNATQLVKEKAEIPAQTV